MNCFMLFGALVLLFAPVRQIFADDARSFKLGSETIVLRSPYTFVECSKVSGLSRLFAPFNASPQILLGGYITQKAYEEFSKEDSDYPINYHFGYASTSDRFVSGDMKGTPSQFAEWRNLMRPDMGAKLRADMSRRGQDATISEIQIVKDDTFSFAYCFLLTVGEKRKAVAIGETLIHGKKISLYLEKFYRADEDMKWAGKAITWWVSGVLEDNPQ